LGINNSFVLFNYIRPFLHLAIITQSPIALHHQLYLLISLLETVDFE